MDADRLAAILAQIAPTDVNTPWMWLSGILAVGIVGVFGVLMRFVSKYIEKIIANEKEWRDTAKEASAELPQMSTTLEKAVEAVRTQQVLIENQNRDIATIKETVARVERHLDDRRRPTGGQA